MGAAQSKETFGPPASGASMPELSKHPDCPQKVSDIITAESEFISFLSQIYF